MKAYLLLNSELLSKDACYVRKMYLRTLVGRGNIFLKYLMSLTSADAINLAQPSHGEDHMNVPIVSKSETLLWNFYDPRWSGLVLLQQTS